LRGFNSVSWGFNSVSRSPRGCGCGPGRREPRRRPGTGGPAPGQAHRLVPGRGRRAPGRRRRRLGRAPGTGRAAPGSGCGYPPARCGREADPGRALAQARAYLRQSAEPPRLLRQEGRILRPCGPGGRLGLTRSAARPLAWAHEIPEQGIPHQTCVLKHGIGENSPVSGFKSPLGHPNAGDFPKTETA
jgi:hypothetical protein